MPERDARPPCPKANPFTDAPCILIPPHDRLHLDADGDRWFYNDPATEERRREALGAALQADAERKRTALSR